MQRYPAYKDSGFDWLGEIPIHWKLERIKHVVTLINEKFDDHSGCFHLSLEDIESHTGQILNSTKFEGSGNLFKKDDVLFNKLRPYLAKVVIAPQDGVGVGELLVLRAKAAIDHQFLHSRMLSKPFIDIVESSTYGAKMPRANWGFLGNLKIPIPPLDEQKAIVAFLEEQTAVINQFLTNKRRLIELLEEQKQVVINTAVTQGLDPTAPRKPSGIDWLGDIPAHWEIKKLWHMINIVGGSTPSKEKPEFWTNGTIPWISPKDMKSLEIISSIDHITEKALQETSIQLINPPVILIVVRGLILARTIPIALTTIPLTINQDMKAMEVKSGDSAKFLSFLLRGMEQYFMAFIEDSGHGTKRFRTNDLKQIFLAMPPLEEQETLLDFIESRTAEINAAIERTQREIELIEEYRTTLIAQAVTGKIDVRPLE